MQGVAEFVDGPCVAGKLMGGHRAFAPFLVRPTTSQLTLSSCFAIDTENELKYLKSAVLAPRRPFLAIIGGSKVQSHERMIATAHFALLLSRTVFVSAYSQVSTKIGVLNSIIDGCRAFFLVLNITIGSNRLVRSFRILQARKGT